MYLYRLIIVAGVNGYGLVVGERRTPLRGPASHRLLLTVLWEDLSRTELYAEDVLALGPEPPREPVT